MTKTKRMDQEEKETVLGKKKVFLPSPFLFSFTESSKERKNKRKEEKEEKGKKVEKKKEECDVKQKVKEGYEIGKKGKTENGW